jgi:tRNA(Ile)-lysidine synthase
LVRPLLRITRREVHAYLAGLDQDYRIDPTNSYTRWTRNRLRHELLPHLRESYNPAIDEAVLRLALQAGEAQEAIAGLAAKIALDWVAVERAPHTRDGSKAMRVRLDCRGLQGAPMIVIREVCRAAWQEAGWPMQAMGFDEWQAIAELVQDFRNRRVNLPGGLQARRQNEIVVLEAAN